MTEPVDNFSIHGNSIKEVYDIPMSAINRPLPSSLERAKVEEMKQKLNDPDHQLDLTPIDVHHVHYKGQDYYFAFGGCHRWAAHKELGRSTIRGKLIQTPPAVINTYLGASSPFK
ncbi:ParB/Sulfiredoxin [Halteromyces radiatus]|uniref:ParB/Sulfiredoxin n=1 Tax=Halteromyces radiatus TaxID=101107 RepID=UPI00221F36F0|nr:ParB/Sulfiredoxin [Halteromyces radiatus]KAI8086242.1 ParB/Sulfiredoxin [Halteromyces radiatus]